MIRWAPEADLGTPYWWGDITSPTLPTDTPSRCDILVIGAGYTGLSAALVAKDGGADVCVVDAGDPGRGASTRNGGMFGAHPRLDWNALEVMFGAETADGVFSEASSALKWVRDLISRENIDCDLQETGRIQLAWTREHLTNQENLTRMVQEKSSVKAEMVPRDNLGNEITTKKYFGGLLFPEHCAIHPAKFHAGLLQAALNRGICVVGDTPVTALKRRSKGFMVTTSNSLIEAGRVILATNGYTPDLFRWHQRRVFPLPSFIVATEELPSNLIGHLAPGRRMMVETRARHSYFRISPDGKRILWGGRAAMVPITPVRAAKQLFSSITEVWPELRGVKLSHAWSGFTGFSFAQMPYVGAEDGLHFAMGYSGSGTVMAPYLGGKAAYQALGDPRGETAYSRTTFKTHVIHRWSKPHFLRLADLWYRYRVDRKETRQSR